MSQENQKKAKEPLKITLQNNGNTINVKYIREKTGVTNPQKC